MKAKLHISSENLRYNIEKIKEKIDNKDIIAMVKANAYGAGDKEIVKVLDNLGINNYGVANIEEALRVREVSKDSMILITCVSVGDEIKESIKNNISMSVSDIENMNEIENIATELGLKAKVHLKIDTGMTRLGFEPEMIDEIIEKILSYENIQIEGIYTHLSCADVDEEFTKSQIDVFQDTVAKLENKINFKYIHFLNSDGTFRYSHYNEKYTHARVGIVMYGYAYDLKPILKLTAPVLHITNVEKYSRVGYGGTAVTKPGQKVAVIKIGYADGLSRLLSNKIQVRYKDKECRQIGNIFMDMTMIDATDLDVKISDDVEIFGYDNNLENIAKLSGKIVYEVISNLGERIQRVIE